MFVRVDYVEKKVLDVCQELGVEFVGWLVKFSTCMQRRTSDAFDIKWIRIDKSAIDFTSCSSVGIEVCEQEETFATML